MSSRRLNGFGNSHQSGAYTIPKAGYDDKMYAILLSSQRKKFCSLNCTSQIRFSSNPFAMPSDGLSEDEICDSTVLGQSKTVSGIEAMRIEFQWLICIPFGHESSVNAAVPDPCLDAVAQPTTLMPSTSLLAMNPEQRGCGLREMVDGLVSELSALSLGTSSSELVHEPTTSRCCPICMFYLIVYKCIANARIVQVQLLIPSLAIIMAAKLISQFRTGQTFD